MKIKNWKIFALIGIPLLSLLMHLGAFSADLLGVHAWRQAQTQSNIVNFIEEDFNIMNPRRNVRGAEDGIYRMEFPIMQWSFATVYKIFGNHFIISRILTFLISLLTALGFYFLLKYLFNNEIIGLIGAWALTFSPAFFYYAVTPLPDNFALCLGIWAVAIFLKSLPNASWKSTVFSAFLMSLAMASKLPFILFYAIPFGFYLQKIYQRKLLLKDFYKGLIWIGLFLPTLIWYLWVIPTWQGNGIVAGILDLAKSPNELIDILLHNLFSNLPELILNVGAVPLFIAGFYFLFKRKAYKHHLFFPTFLWSFLTLLYFLFELNMIGKVHDYYLFPFYPFLFILVSYGAFWLFQKSRIITTILLISLPVFAFARMQGRWNEADPRFNKVLLTHKTVLRNLSKKDDLIIVGNDASYAIFFYHLDRKGWAFAENRLTPNDLISMINQGAKYLYSDANLVNENPEIKAITGTPIYEIDKLKVYKLNNDSSKKE